MAARESATSMAHTRRKPPLEGLELSVRVFENLPKVEAGDGDFLTRVFFHSREISEHSAYEIEINKVRYGSLLRSRGKDRPSK